MPLLHPFDAAISSKEQYYFELIKYLASKCLLCPEIVQPVRVFLFPSLIWVTIETL